MVENRKQPDLLAHLPLHNTAFSWDVDDSIVRRERITRIGGTAAHVAQTAFLGKVPHLRSLASLEPLDRTLSTQPVTSLAERISLAMHGKRIVDNRAEAVIAILHELGANQFVNTGRSDKNSWVAMTKKTFADSSVEKAIAQYFFTPKETMKTAESKADALRTLKSQYDRVIHIEDDPRTALYLAEQCKDVTIYVIDYPSSRFLADERKLAEKTNIKRIKNVTHLLRDFLSNKQTPA